MLRVHYFLSDALQLPCSRCNALNLERGSPSRSSRAAVLQLLDASLIQRTWIKWLLHSNSPLSAEAHNDSTHLIQVWLNSGASKSNWTVALENLRWKTIKQNPSLKSELSDNGAQQ